MSAHPNEDDGSERFCPPNAGCYWILAIRTRKAPVSMENICGCCFEQVELQRGQKWAGLRGHLSFLFLSFAFPFFFFARNKWRRFGSYFHRQWMKAAECHPSSWQMRQDDLLYLLTVIPALHIGCPPAYWLLVIMSAYDVFLFFFLGCTVGHCHGHPPSWIWSEAGRLGNNPFTSFLKQTGFFL